MQQQQNQQQHPQHGGGGGYPPLANALPPAPMPGSSAQDFASYHQQKRHIQQQQQQQQQNLLHPNLGAMNKNNNNGGGAGGGGVTTGQILGAIANPHNGGVVPNPAAGGGGKKGAAGGAPAKSTKKNNNNNNNNNDDDDDSDGEGAFPESLLLPDGTVPEELKNLEPRLVARIATEILESTSTTTWDDIAGLQHAKDSVEEAVVWPMLNPKLFRGVRAPTKGLLLFGPPGTGKTLVAKAIANGGNCTFFAVSSSVLMSKWIGEGEKLVRCLFAVARVKQPSVVFIDEIDSMLTTRQEGEGEASRRVKTEFLVHLDGVATTGDDRVLIVGATNRPEELDEAARRRLEKRLYIPLPDLQGRIQMVKIALRTLLQEQEREREQDQQHSSQNGGGGARQSSGGGDKQHIALSDADFEAIARRARGFSGADMKLLAREASMNPVREYMSFAKRQPGFDGTIDADRVRPINAGDFAAAFEKVKPSVSAHELERYIDWNGKFGSFQIPQLAEADL
jgi:SpoVK/Ycf46/Vps4 family AAA+-type ATPase